jgi:hypothetical protein
VEAVRERDAGERENGADGEVDAAGDDHIREAHRDDGVDDRLLRDVEQVIDREEMRCQARNDAAEDEQHGEGAGLTGIGGDEAGQFHAASCAARAQ